MEERIVAAAQNKRVMNALVMRDAPGAGGIGEDGKDGNEGGGQARAVPMAELLRAVMDGCRCIENGGAAGADGGTANVLNGEEIEAILDRAEADFDLATNATDSGRAGTCLGNNYSKLADVAPNLTARDQMELENRVSNGGSAPTPVQAEDADQGEADLNGTQAALAKVFRSLPAIREFEGRDYSGRRKRDSESAAAFRGLADIWEKQHLPLRQLDTEPAGKKDDQDIPAEKGRKALLHRRRCQKCQRSVGSMLFCSRYDLLATPPRVSIGLNLRPFSALRS